MSDFYGYLQGNRGEVTRAGSLNSGIRATLQSWANRFNCSLQRKEETDILNIDVSDYQGSKRKFKIFVNGKEVKEAEEYI